MTSLQICFQFPLAPLQLGVGSAAVNTIPADATVMGCFAIMAGSYQHPVNTPSTSGQHPINTLSTPRQRPFNTPSTPYQHHPRRRHRHALLRHHGRALPTSGQHPINIRSTNYYQHPIHTLSTPRQHPINTQSTPYQLRINTLSTPSPPTPPSCAASPSWQDHSTADDESLPPCLV
jgi:hypothetical protein